jgi:hypothetical protein
MVGIVVFILAPLRHLAEITDGFVLRFKSGTSGSAWMSAWRAPCKARHFRRRKPRLTSSHFAAGHAGASVVNAASTTGRACAGFMCASSCRE